jgi:hypothetical protein
VKTEPAAGLESKARAAVGFGYFYLPASVYRYLEDALKSLCEVQYFGTPYKGRPGFSPDDNILDFVENKGRDYAGLIATENCLFAGLTELECPTAIWFADYWPGNYDRLRYARLFDHVFVSQRDWMQDFTAAGCPRVYWLPFACDPEIHRDFQLERTYDVGFVGHINLNVQQERLRLLTALARRYRMNDFLQPVYLGEMAKVYSQSKIVVNMPNCGGFNMRVFEAMACGAMLLTEDTGNGQKELFKAGVHLDVYRSRPELFEKIDYYLAHEEEREAIAAAGQREVRTRHRYADRAQAMLSVLAQDAGARYRSSNADEVLRAYTLFRSRRNNFAFMLRGLTRSRCSLATRAYIAARIVKSTINVLRAPR